MSKTIKTIILLVLWPLFAVCQVDDTKGKFTDINEALKKANQVIQLQLSAIKEPLPDMGKFINLKTVRLINLPAEYDLKDAFEKLSKTKVEELYLYGNLHNELPSEITTLKYLKKIDLNSALAGKLESTLDVLSQNQQIEYIGLHDFGLIFIPTQITKFKKLKALDLSGNPSLAYDQVFDVLSKIETIESLNFMYNYFNGLPLSIIKVKKIKQLNFCLIDGKLNVPETYRTLSQLEYLEDLDISGNFFGELPVEIALLNRLKVLNIDGCAITIDGTEFKKLKELLPNTKLIVINPY